MRERERQQWTEFVRARAQRKVEKPVGRRRRQKPQPTQAENDAVLDDLIREASENQSDCATE
jgi:hypothetical protein